MPEVRGTTDFYGGAYPLSKTSPSYALTTLIIFCWGRAGGTDSSIPRHADTVAHHFCANCGGGVVYAMSPVRTPQ